MSAKTATIIGVTGLIGNELLGVLLQDPFFETVRLLVRRPYQISHPKVETKLINFSDYESFKLGIDGSDAVFCAVGTTQQKVKGNKEAYRKVDYDIAVNAARFCKETGCSDYALVSSVGADAGSSNFYLKLKGEIEAAVKQQGVRSVSVFRPSVLLGDRKETRPGERIAQVGMQVFSFALINNWSKYKPIAAKDIAKAMVAAAKGGKEGFTVYEYDGIRELLE